MKILLNFREERGGGRAWSGFAVAGDGGLFVKMALGSLVSVGKYLCKVTASLPSQN